MKDGGVRETEGKCKGAEGGKEAEEAEEEREFRVVPSAIATRDRRRGNRRS